MRHWKAYIMYVYARPRSYYDDTETLGVTTRLAAPRPCVRDSIPSIPSSSMTAFLRSFLSRDTLKFFQSFDILDRKLSLSKGRRETESDEAETEGEQKVKFRIIIGYINRVI